MVYVCSDIHADYNLFIKLLNKINFSRNDVMYIGGDILDKGQNSMKLLQFIKNTPNIHTIVGNHEYDFLKHYWAIMENSPTDFNKTLKTLQNYFEFDGHLLNWDTVDYLESLPYYIETENFILVHAGLPINKDNKIAILSSVKPEFLVYDRHFKEPNVLPSTDKCILFGHTPTSYICNEPKILKYKKSGFLGDKITDYCKIHLDVGTWLNKTMGCLCIDTLEEFYVT